MATELYIYNKVTGLEVFPELIPPQEQENVGQTGEKKSNEMPGIKNIYWQSSSCPVCLYPFDI